MKPDTPTFTQTKSIKKKDSTKSNPQWSNLQESKERTSTAQGSLAVLIVEYCNKSKLVTTTK